MQTNEVKTKAAIEQEKNQACLDSSEREQARPQVKRVHNLIIVDESGSMEVIRKQAFVGMNETLQTVRKMQEKFVPIIHKMILASDELALAF